VDTVFFFPYLTSIAKRFPQLFSGEAGEKDKSTFDKGVAQKTLGGWGWFPYVWTLANEDATKVETVLLLNHQTCLTTISYLVDKAEVERFNMNQSFKHR
jgi:hypothetical protein